MRKQIEFEPEYGNVGISVDGPISHLDIEGGVMKELMINIEHSIWPNITQPTQKLYVGENRCENKSKRN